MILVNPNQFLQAEKRLNMRRKKRKGAQKNHTAGISKEDGSS